MLCLRQLVGVTIRKIVNLGVSGQAVFFPAGARALPVGNPKTSQEILTKAADKCLSWRKMIYFK
jgi:hypothetical protein